MWMDVNGSVYFGGQLLVGILCNVVQMMIMQIVGVELVNGLFVINGCVWSVIVSFFCWYIWIKIIYGSDGFVVGVGQNMVCVEVYCWVGEGVELFWQVLNVSGLVMIFNEQDGLDNVMFIWGGLFIVNDISISVQMMIYCVVIISFIEQIVMYIFGFFQQQFIMQSLLIILVEN